MAEISEDASKRCDERDLTFSRELLKVGSVTFKYAMVLPAESLIAAEIPHHSSRCSL